MSPASTVSLNAQGETHRLPMQRRLVTARLTAVVMLLDRSGALAYRRETGLLDFDWRVLAVAGWRAPVSFSELAATLTQDKGQISRAVKRLEIGGLLSHPHPRAKIIPTSAGRRVCEKLDRLFAERNAAITAGVSEQELEVLGQLLARVTENARTLLEEQARQEATAEHPERLAANLSRLLLRERAGSTLYNARFAHSVSPALTSLLAFIRKSAAMTFRRELGLLDFDWRVIVQIGEHAPIELSRLVAMMSRDKSQVGRAITRLEKLDLVVRRPAPGGGRNVMILATQKGETVYARLAERALRRDDVLRRGLSDDDHQLLMALLDKLRANADAMYRVQQEVQARADRDDELRAMS